MNLRSVEKRGIPERRRKKSFVDTRFSISVTFVWGILERGRRNGLLCGKFV